MAERNRVRRPEAPGPGPDGWLSGMSAGGIERPPTAMVACGPYMEHLPVGGMTVGAIRSRFGDRLDVDPLAQAVIDGTEAAEDAVLQSGQLLTFVRKAGEKGSVFGPARDGGRPEGGCHAPRR